MIYTARKNGHTRTFSIDEAGGMEKLRHYRRQHWQITANLGRLEREPRPAPQINREKPVERRERHFARVMGYRVVLD